jgi:hypothetical protein
MASREIKPMSAGKRALYYIVVALVIPLAMILFFQGRGAARQPFRDVNGFRLIAMVAGTLIVSGVLFAIGGAGYVLMIATRALTFNFQAPVFKGYKLRAVVTHMLWPIPISIAVVLLMNAVLQVAFRLAGVRVDPAMPALIVALMILNLFVLRVNVWAPNETGLPRRRLLALGVTESQLARGTYVGISDPAVKTSRGMLENDMGMLWLEPDRLIYRGDDDGFEVSRETLLEVERVVVPRSASAYAGNRYIVLRFQQQDGTQRRVRLHVEGAWTMGRLVKMTDALADRLNVWAGDGHSSRATRRSEHVDDGNVA